MPRVVKAVPAIGNVWVAGGVVDVVAGAVTVAGLQAASSKITTPKAPSDCMRFMAISFCHREGFGERLSYRALECPEE